MPISKVFKVDHGYSVYLQESQIENLRLYKYAAVDKSPVSRYILKPYWDFAIKLFPTWIAPNLITLIGLLFMIINVIIVCIWSPNLDTNAPNWINFSFAAGLWLYSTFDNVDGRQARRTGTSSPLGELFDHGCDAINCTFVALLQTAALGLGHTTSAAVLLFVTVTGFYLSTAEEYYTGVLYLGYVNGPTEGIIVTCLAFIWSGIYGIASWHTHVQEVSWLSWTGYILPSSTNFADLFVWGMVFFFAVTHLPVCIYSIYQACKEKGLNFIAVINRVFLPIIISGILIYTWTTSPKSTVFSHGHFILFTLLIGINFGEMASDIILAHLTKSAFPSFYYIYQMLLVLSLFTGITSYFNIDSSINEYFIIAIFFIVSTVSYFIRAVRVVNAFCKFLNIRCFVIPYSKQKDQNFLPKTASEEEAESLLVEQESGSSNRNQHYSTFE